MLSKPAIAKTQKNPKKVVIKPRKDTSTLTTVEEGTRSVCGFKYHYASVIQGLFPIESLQRLGVTTIPVIATEQLEDFQKQFTEAVQSFPEYKPGAALHHPLVLGGFGALGNPSSFHHPLFRFFRGLAQKEIRPLLQEYVARNYPSDKQYFLQTLFDRVMVRRVGQKPTPETWHRDVFPRKNKEVLGEDDIIFGGWINFDSTPQYFSAIPGSHRGLRLVDLDEGFALVEKAVKPEHRRQVLDTLSRDSYRFVVPPGHMVVFPQHILHEIVATPASHDMLRLFTGWRITAQRNSLYEPQVFEEQSIVPLPGGMLPPLYSKNHFRFYLNKEFRVTPSYTTTVSQWSTDVFPQSRLKEVTKDGKTYLVAPRDTFSSLKALGLPLYLRYNKKELAIYTGVPLN